MGLFLSMSGVIGATAGEVVGSLRQYAIEHSGLLEPKALALGDAGCLVVASGPSGVTILYPEEFLGWDDSSIELSKRLSKPVFSLHIHDGDLWMYLLFKDGELLDQFNPMPDYWEELDEKARVEWQGNATIVARCVPGLAPEQVANYLTPWGDDVLFGDSPRKAYASDEYTYGQDWQVVDFMTRLGLRYPDNGGDVIGDSYLFRCKSEPS